MISEVEARNKILFGSLSSGISTKTKKNLLAWENGALSVNEVGADSRTVKHKNIRKKVVKKVDIKVNVKNRCMLTIGCSRTPKVSIICTPT